MTQIQDLTTHQAALISVQQLASYWGVSDRTVYRLITKGALTAVRVSLGGKRPLLRIRTVEARALGRIDA